MPNPQPTTAAMWLADAAWCAVQNFGTDGLSDDERVVRIALALDDAGVGRAVEALDMIYRHPEQPLKVQAWATTALASLTGDDDAK